MVRKLFATGDSIAAAIPRLVLGVVFFAYGAQKMLGCFGGFGFSATMDAFTRLMPCFDSAAQVAWLNAQKTKG
jgi:putative oxidoreductase